MRRHNIRADDLHLRRGPVLAGAGAVQLGGDPGPGGVRVVLRVHPGGITFKPFGESRGQVAGAIHRETQVVDNEIAVIGRIAFMDNPQHRGHGRVPPGQIGPREDRGVHVVQVEAEGQRDRVDDDPMMLPHVVRVRGAGVHPAHVIRAHAVVVPNAGRGAAVRTVGEKIVPVVIRPFAAQDEIEVAVAVALGGVEPEIQLVAAAAARALELHLRLGAGPQEQGVCAGVRLPVNHLHAALVGPIHGVIVDDREVGIGRIGIDRVRQVGGHRGVGFKILAKNVRGGSRSQGRPPQQQEN